MAVQLKFSEIQIFLKAAYFPPLTEVEEIISDITIITSQNTWNNVLNCGEATSTVGDQLFELMQHIGFGCINERIERDILSICVPNIDE